MPQTGSGGEAKPGCWKANLSGSFLTLFSHVGIILKMSPIVVASLIIYRTAQLCLLMVILFIKNVPLPNLEGTD